MKKNFTILVADKNRNVRDFLRRELSEDGYDIVVATDGNQVEARIESDTAPDLLVIDLEAPEIDGSKILEMSQTRRPPLPVIIHTFLTEESVRDRVQETESYIEKSGNLDHLRSAIEEMLKKFYPDRFMLGCRSGAASACPV